MRARHLFPSAHTCALAPDVLGAISDHLLCLHRVRWWPGSGALDSSLLYSTDGVTFTMLTSLPTNTLSAQSFPAPNVPVRALAVRHTVK